MAFIKTKAEREIEESMAREEQMETFNETIKSLKSKTEEYARIAAEAEIAGDVDNYNVACNAIIELNNNLSVLQQYKTNFDIINVSNSVALSMATAMGSLERMAGNKANLPDIRKIQKASTKVAKYMKSVKISNKALASAMRTSNPANTSRTPDEMAAIRPLIDAARAKMTGTAGINVSGIDISSEIENEKNKLG